MRLSTILQCVDYDYTLRKDGEFELVEQCTRIRGNRALTFIENGKYVDNLANENISCVLCKPELEQAIPSHITGVVITENPKFLFFLINNLLHERRERVPSKIDATAQIHPTAVIAENNVVIGANVEIGPNVVINENCTIEDDVCIYAGAVLGGQGFTAMKDGAGKVYLAKDAGRVVIKRGVELCSMCHIACGTLGHDVTYVGEYSKIDALVHIGHGAHIGKRVLITACALISGNCIIGDDVWVGVNATISNRVEIGNDARVSLGSVVTKNVADNTVVTGNFAVDHKKFLSNLKKSLED